VARTANPGVRPWPTLLPTLPARVATVREVLEALNHALVISRATHFHAEFSVSCDTTLDVLTILHTLTWSSADRDRDAQSYLVEVWTGSGGTARLEVSDDNWTTTWQTGNISGGSPYGSVTFTPAAAPDSLLRFRIRGQGGGGGNLTVVRIRVREANLAAANIPIASTA